MGFAGGIGVAQWRLEAGRRRCLYWRRFLDLVGFGAGGLEVLLHLGFQILALRAEDGLQAVADDDHAGGAQGFQFIDAGFGDIVEFNAQARDAGIETSDIAASAKSANELEGEAVATGAARGLGGFRFHFASGSEEVKPADGKGKNAVIHGSPERPDNKEPERAMRFREKDDVVDEPVREGEAMFDAERDAEEVGRAGEDCVDAVENWCDEEEGELDWFGDAGEESSERGGDHDAANFFALLGTSGAPHGEGGSGQAEHFEKVTTTHVAGSGIAGDEAGDFAVDDRPGGIGESA